ncbi:MAG: aldehyde ferredoxin oxidoreductase N-terminal domain-containing protein [Candidatus Hodarchaeales archaeon]|jgi:aldehyde:ferredoxin oxidoreductase
MNLEDILEIDLTTQNIKRYSRPELFEKWIGGIGVGINLLQEHVSPNAYPLGPDNALIFTIGTLSTLYPIISKTVALFRSPLTGDLGESHAGGRLSLAMRFAGLGALIIKGQAEKSCYITITDDDVQINRSGPLAYMYTSTLGRVLREKVPVGPGRRTSIRIGPASENLVKYGNIIVDSFRHFGRLGAGAVMGSKRLKAIIISGKKDIPLNVKPINRQSYNKTYKKIWNDCVHTPIMRKYHVYGTPENVLPLNELNALPTRNFQKGKFDFAEEISGEKFVESYLGRRVSCNTCPVGCIHVAILRERYGSDSPADIHSLAVPYDFELIYALGSNLEIPDGPQILRLIEETERLGMDSITTGVVLGWMAEAFEKGLITKEDTNGLEIRFGHSQDFIKVIKRIAFRESNNRDLFWYAGEGLHTLVDQYGGKEFAMMFNKNPPAGYSTGPYAIIGQVIGGRHSHLDNAGYSIDQKSFKNKPDLSDAILQLVKEEEWRNVLNSLVICLFAKNIYPPNVVIECFNNFGIQKTKSELFKLGQEIQKLRIETKIQFGMNYGEIINKLPDRIFQMPTAHGKISRNEIKKLLISYNSILKERYDIPLG